MIGKILFLKRIYTPTIPKEPKFSCGMRQFAAWIGFDPLHALLKKCFCFIHLNAVPSITIDSLSAHPGYGLQGRH